MGNGAAKGGGGGGGMAEGEYATVKTSVWWDIENCAVPRGSDPHHIAQNISSSLVSLGYKGPVSISAFGDTNQIPEPVKQALHSTGISLHHVPAGVKDASDKKILVDMLFWAVDNPPPANYLLISGDRDFSYALHQLRMRRYNVLLARQPNVSQALEAAAMIVWHWKDLVVGLPPLSESPYTSSVANNGVPELSTKIVPDAASTQSSNFPTSDYKTNQKISGNGRDDSRNKGKHIRKIPNQNQVTRDVPKTSVDQYKQPSNGSSGVGTNHDLPELEQQNLVHMSSVSVSQDVASLKCKGASFTPQSSPQKFQTEAGNSNRPDTKNLSETHEFYRGKTDTSAGPLSGQIRPFSIKSNKSSIPNKIPEYPQLLKPSDLLSSHSSNVSGSLSSNHQNNSSYRPPIRPHGPPFTSMPTRPHGPPVSPGPPGRCTISDSSTSGLQNTIYFPQAADPINSFPSNPKDQQSAQIMYMQRPLAPTGRDSSLSNYRQSGAPGCYEADHLIRNIMHALNVLKADKMAPTEAHIADCIHYGEINIRNFNVKAALDCAILYQVVVMLKFGNNLPFYVGKDDKLWKWVDVMDCNAEFPSATWDVIYSFLRLPAGRMSIKTSECRYHAATILRKLCLNHLVLGDVLQILHVIINIKKWIIPQSQGWQPLSINVEASSDGPSTGKPQPSRKSGIYRRLVVNHQGLADCCIQPKQANF